MLGLVAAEKALGLDLGGGTTGKLLVETDDALHAQSVGSGSDRLSEKKSVCYVETFRVHVCVEVMVVVDGDFYAVDMSASSAIVHPIVVHNRSRNIVGEFGRRVFVP